MFLLFNSWSWLLGKSWCCVFCLKNVEEENVCCDWFVCYNRFFRSQITCCTVFGVCKLTVSSGMLSYTYGLFYFWPSLNIKQVNYFQEVELVIFCSYLLYYIPVLPVQLHSVLCRIEAMLTYEGRIEISGAAHSTMVCLQRASFCLHLHVIKFLCFLSPTLKPFLLRVLIALIWKH